MNLEMNLKEIILCIDYDLIIDICHISGIFTVPVSGVWRMTFSMTSFVRFGEGNLAILHLNGNKVEGSQYYTYCDAKEVDSTGGRQVLMEFKQGDNIDIRTTRMDYKYHNINFCAEYVPKMFF